MVAKRGGAVTVVGVDSDGNLDLEELERAITPQLRVGGTAGWQHVTFMNAPDRFTHAGADVTFDTRLDPMLGAARDVTFGDGRKMTVGPPAGTGGQ